MLMFKDTLIFWLQEIVTRLGRWIDFDNDYKTLYPWFMESIWYVVELLTLVTMVIIQVGVQAAL